MDCSFGDSGQYCFLIMTTVLMTSMMMRHLTQKKTAYSLSGGVPGTLMKRLENKYACVLSHFSHVRLFVTP